jgi:hypothetical protein
MRRRRTFIAILLATIIGFAAIDTPVPCPASEPELTNDAAEDRPARRMRRLERRRKREREQQAARVEQPSARYQMKIVEGRVIVLDTQTGDVRVIDPTDDGAKQRVEIGESWITVTVLVNATNAKSRQKPSADSGSGE